jgi:hypothetical protein
MVERVISLKNNGVLTMDNYDVIAGTSIESLAQPRRAEKSHPSVDLESIRKLAGLR